MSPILSPSLVSLRFYSFLHLLPSPLLHPLSSPLPSSPCLSAVLLSTTLLLPSSSDDDNDVGGDRDGDDDDDDEEEEDDIINTDTTTRFKDLS